MKFYNPFKPHIVVDGFGKYWIRVISLLGWKYYDDSDAYFYYSKWFAKCYSALPMKELQGAIETLKKDKERLKKGRMSDKVVRIK